MSQLKRPESCNPKTYAMNLLMFLASENQDISVVIAVMANEVMHVVTVNEVMHVVTVNEVTDRDLNVGTVEKLHMAKTAQEKGRNPVKLGTKRVTTVKGSTIYQHHAGQPSLLLPPPQTQLQLQKHLP